ncbi:hypothetical protein, partial [Klebsiella michiganensis]|uniref:hypothetical protein n=1 Tax=Klebsiella michiganensis TaxID=1134687 RepID=UPI0019539705
SWAGGGVSAVAAGRRCGCGLTGRGFGCVAVFLSSASRASLNCGDVSFAPPWPERVRLSLRVTELEVAVETVPVVV